MLLATGSQNWERSAFPFPHWNISIQPSCHPLWTTTGSSPFEVSKAAVQAKMLSGRFRTEKLCRFWSSNPEGFCLAPTCVNKVEDLEHILCTCKALAAPRKRLQSAWLTKASSNPHLHQLLINVLASPPDQFCRFVLDPSNHPDVISHSEKWWFYFEEHLLPN